MQFPEDYQKIIRNYRQLSSVEKFIIWTRFATTPLGALLEKIPQQGYFLDLGCGFGALSYFFALKFPNLNVIGVDPSENRLRLTENVYKKPKNLKFQSGKIDDLIINCLSGVALIDVINYLSQEELVKTLRICHDKVREDGVLIIKTMNKDRFLRYWLTVFPSLLIKVVTLFFRASKTFGIRESFLYYYSPDKFKKILAKNGWQTLEILDLPLRFFVFPNIIYFCRKNR